MAAIEMDYIKDLLVKIHTTATIKTYNEVKLIEKIIDDSRMLVYPGEIINVNLDIITKIYKVIIEEESELKMMAAINNIVDGLDDMSNGVAIATYVKPAILLNGKFIGSDIAIEDPTSKIWRHNIQLQFKWCTS